MSTDQPRETDRRASREPHQDAEAIVEAARKFSAALQVNEKLNDAFYKTNTALRQRLATLASSPQLLNDAQLQRVIIHLLTVVASLRNAFVVALRFSSAKTEDDLGVLLCDLALATAGRRIDETRHQLEEQCVAIAAIFSPEMQMQYTSHRFGTVSVVGSSIADTGNFGDYAPHQRMMFSTLYDRFIALIRAKLEYIRYLQECGIPVAQEVAQMDIDAACTQMRNQQNQRRKCSR